MSCYTCLVTDFQIVALPVKQAILAEPSILRLLGYIRRYSTFDEAFIDLLNGRLDTIFGGTIGLSVGFLDTEQGKNYHFSGPKFTDEKWFGKGVGIAIRKQDKDLKEKLDRALKQIITDGEHSRIAKKYFSHGIM
ncbi:transporter substrate-binding domain-containing protein [Vibrio caribbeanicus]|nr:transporter substrate-binding domain-containing protein [Vibrio caribbeanicus]